MELIINKEIPSEFSMLHFLIQNFTYSLVGLTDKRGEPGKKLKKADFGIIRKQFFL